MTRCALAILFVLLLLPASASAAASTDTAARAAADRVARDLAANGDVLAIGSDTVTLTLDAILLLAATGTSGDTARRATNRVVDARAAYLAGAGSGDMGRRAKLAFVLLVAGREDAAAPLLADVRASIQPDGRFGTTTNVFGQSFGVLALARTADGVPTAATDYLARQQCTTAASPQRGGFGYGSCGSVDGDATGIAVSALLGAGTPADDPVLADATDWMVRTQLADGSFGMRMSSANGNANSTGLVAHAARQLGAAGIAVADSGATYVRELQVTCGSPLITGDDPSAGGGFPTSWRGAIAYDAATQDAAIANGIPSGQLTAWRYTTVQAALAMPTVRSHRDMSLADAEPATTPLPACPAGTPPPTPATPATGDDDLPAATFGVRTDRRPVATGARTTVRATGLAPRESWTILVSGRVLARGSATGAGTLAQRVVVPRTFGSHPRRIVRIVGSVARRSGTSTLATAAPRLLVVPTTRRVRRGALLRLPIGGLLPGERWTGSVAGRELAHGTTSATAAAHATLATRITLPAGTHRLLVCGASCARRAVVRVEVVV